LRYSTSPDNFKLKVMGIRSTLDVALDDMEGEMSAIEREIHDEAVTETQEEEEAAEAKGEDEKNSS